MKVKVLVTQLYLNVFKKKKTDLMQVKEAAWVQSIYYF